VNLNHTHGIIMSLFTSARSVSLRKIVRSDISSTSRFDEINDAFKDFQSSISSVVEDNLTLLEEVPLLHNLRFEELKEFLANQIKQDLNEDMLFEKSVELSRYARNMFEYMDTYFNEIFRFHQELRKELLSEMFDVSKIFLNSDLPTSFLNVIEDSLLTEIDFIEIFDKEIRREQLDLVRFRNNLTKFKRVCDTHNLWVRQFDETRSKMENARVKIIWYVDFNNSETVNEIFKEKTIKVSLLDKSILNNLIAELRDNIEKMDRLNARKMEILSTLKYEPNEATNALLKIIQILNR